MYKNKTVIQIGSHVGDTINDPIFEKVDLSTNLILIEPVEYLFNILKYNYNEKYKNNNFLFINKAVSNFIGKIEMTIPSQKNNFLELPFYASQLSSINPYHVKLHLPNIITEKIEVETTTLNNIVDEFKIKEIELLHIDTEGHDYEILMNYNFKIKPKTIIFEHKHSDGFLKNGIRLKTILNRLYSINYKLTYKNEEDITMVLIE